MQLDPLYRVTFTTPESWSVTRPGGLGAPVVAALGPCRGCPRGCVECRERIDA